MNGTHKVSTIAARGHSLTLTVCNDCGGDVRKIDGEKAPEHLLPFGFASTEQFHANAECVAVVEPVR